MGLGCARSWPEGASRLAALKGRETEKFIVLFPDADAVSRVTALTPESRATTHRHWPGPITFILPLVGGGTIAARVPRDEFLARWLALVGTPILSTSCNRHGEPPAESAAQARAVFGGGVDLYIDGPAPLSPVASTLVDLTGERPVVVRRGAIPFD